MTPEQVEDVRALVNHRGWIGTFVPALEGARDLAIRQLIYNNHRTTQESDDQLRAKVQVYEQLLRMGPALLEEFELDRRELERLQRLELEYAARADAGRYAPFSE